MTLSAGERTLLIAGAAALAIASVLAVDLLTYKGVGYDFAAYILAARRLVSGEALYPADPTTLIPGPFGFYRYSPVTAVAFIPLAALPFALSRLLWFSAMIAQAGLLVVLLAHPHRPAVRPLVFAAAILFFPLLWEVQQGNLTLLTLLCCLLAWRFRRAGSSGVLLAVGVMLKLMPLPIPLFFAFAGRWRVLVVTGLVLAVAVLATLPWLATEWAAYLQVVRAIATFPPGEGTNIVPNAFSVAPLRWLLPVIAIGTAIVCGSLARAAPGHADRAFALSLAATPLLAPTLWYPYLIFAMPLLLAVPQNRVFGVGKVIAGLAMWLQMLREPGRDFTLPFYGLLLLIALGAVELLLERRSQRSVSASAA